MAANNRVLVIDSDLDAVVAVDLTSGTHMLFSNSTTPNATNSLSKPVAISMDIANNRTLVVDSDLAAVVAVNLTSGARSILSNATIPDATNPFINPIAIALDSANNRALVVDANLDAVIAVDLTSGARTIFSNATIPNGVTPFNNPIAITLDATNDRALVLVADGGLSVSGAVLAVDLSSGARTMLSDATTPDTSNPFWFPRAITLDAATTGAHWWWTLRWTPS